MFYKISFAGYRTKNAVLLEVLVSLFRCIPGDFKFKAEFVDGGKHIIFYQHPVIDRFDNAVGKLQIFWSSRIVINEEVFENIRLLHGESSNLNQTYKFLEASSINHDSP